MLYFDIKRILMARSISRPHKFFTSNGFSGSYATKLINNDIRNFDVRYLEKLCSILKCTPNDLLQWIPDKGQQADTNHPLYPLLKVESKLSDALLNAPVDKLKDIENFVLAVSNKTTP